MRHNALKSIAKCLNDTENAKRTNLSQKSCKCPSLGPRRDKSYILDKFVTRLKHDHEHRGREKCSCDTKETLQQLKVYCHFSLSDIE